MLSNLRLRLATGLPRRAWWAVLLLAVAAGGGYLAIDPAVRRIAIRQAQARGFAIEIGSVRPGWFRVSLFDVQVRPAGVTAVTAALPSVTVELSVSLSPTEVRSDGGAVTLTGSAADLRGALESWRKNRPPSARADGGSKVALRGSGISLQWSDPNGATVSVQGAAFSRDQEGTRLTVESGRISEGSLGLEVGKADLGLDGAGHVQGIRLGVAALGLELSAPPGGPEPAAPATGEPPALPPPLDRHKGPPLPAVTDASVPLLNLPELHLVRAAVASATAELASRLPQGGFVEIGGLSLAIQKGGERLSIGPGPLTVRRMGERIAIDFSTSAVANGTPLTLRAEIPTDNQDVELSLAGGPVSLSLLGVKEGAAGVTDVDRATVAGRGRVVLDGRGESLTFDVTLSVRGMAVHQPRLAADTLRGLDFGLSARGLLTDKRELRIDDAEGTLGALHLQLHGGLEQASDHVAAAIEFDVPPASCQALLQSVPTALLPAVGGASMVGTLAGKGRLAFDTRRLEDLVLDYDIADRCRMASVPDDLAKERFTKEFSHRIYLKDGSVSDETTGPGTANWTDLDRISPYMQVAVLTTEDGAFFHHHGFNHAAIRGAVIANLKARKFVRGASTITMQLAKNLFLTREKTLGRKLEELILTDYLEQAFTKEEMMELYLNIIEFGPDIYGVTAASEHYFGRKPEELDLAESLFLSSILPSPLRYHSLWEKGAVSDAWMRGLHDRMEIASRTGKISATELTQALAEPVTFWHPEMARPVPRQLPAERHDPDAPWQQTN